MELTITPLHSDPRFAAEVNGLNLAAGVDDDVIKAIELALDKHGVLILRNQHLDPGQQIDFTKRFGPLEYGFNKMLNKSESRLKHIEIADISNVTDDGKIADRNHRRIVNNMANQLWHSDVSFQNPPARFSMLYSVLNPSWGGETEFADMRAAYDDLEPRLKQHIAELQAEHFSLHSRFVLGDTQYTQDQIDAIPKARWPLVRIHPGSGRPLLFIGAHASHVVDMPVAEGRVLLTDLLEQATQPAHVYRHQWQTGDFVIWDNRAVLHRGRRYDLAERRELRRTTTMDVGQDHPK
ncbi:TauD/TfdA dioxygenase family protein [Marinobacter sp. F3R11]|uniref:TauD/TfdA dioxygenase family protein n=1 Tax=Marinobacter sp. F3R11 TaxID=2267231 RepID=UPI000DE9442C|nr:TauD/TfdA family dioxygenase [Marinobacter sp. F3R11]RBW49308.1 TauD/TfdA family dioxygenase [Marinobacter sp. F3R11]